MRLPPVEFLHLPQAASTEKRVVAEAREKERIETFVEPPQGLDVEMIVVPVAHEDQLHRRQGIERDGRWPGTARTGKCHRADAVAPDRVGQHVEPVGELEKESAVSDERGGDLIGADVCRQGGGY